MTSEITTGPDPRRAAAFGTFSKGAALATMAVGAAALLGWLLDVPVLKSFVPGLVTMKANAALAFVLAGLSLHLLQPGPHAARWHLLAQAAAAGTALIGAVTLSQYLFGWDLRIDQWLFDEPAGAIGTSEPGRMAPLTAVNLLLLGAGLLSIEIETTSGQRPAQFLALAAFAIAFLPALGYAYSVSSLTGIGPLTVMSLNTTLIFLVLSLGVLAARPDRGLMALCASAGPGGQMTRRLLPVTVLVPAMLGALRLAGENAGLFDTKLGVALFVVAVSALLSFIIYRYSADLQRAFEQNQDAARLVNETLERRVMERTAKLDAANEAMEAFGYSVAHDLRTPLRAMDGFATVLEEDYGSRLDETGKAALHRVRAAAQVMGKLIEDLLRLSRLSQQPMNLQALDLSELARAGADTLKASDPARQVTFEIAPRATAHADRGLLAVVLDNLLGNAWKFTRKHPAARIEFGVGRHAGEPVYFVRDDGAGFDMAHAQKLFTPFHRIHAATDFPGSGIGLSMVHRIIARHGGRVWAESAVEKGATFFFTLPAAAIAAPAGGSNNEPA